MYGFIGAMQVEVEGLTALLRNHQEKKIGDFLFHLGKLEDKDVVIVKSGIGKTAAATCTAVMALEFNPKCIVNTGVAGGVSREVKLKPLDIVIATKVAHHDMDVSPLGYERGVVPGEEKYFECDPAVTELVLEAAGGLDTGVYQGVICSGDEFVSSSAKSAEIANAFNAYAVDMESASIGHACKIMGVPFGIIRALSDCADEQATMSYTELEEIAAGHAMKLVREFLRLS